MHKRVLEYKKYTGSGVNSINKLSKRNTTTMRTLSSPHRNHPTVPPRVPNQKDENLASIMERRRVLADSGRGDDFSVSSAISRDSRSSMRSDLYDAMQRRRRIANNGSVRSMNQSSQQSGISMESGTQADDEYDDSSNNTYAKDFQNGQQQESAEEFEYEYEVEQDDGSSGNEDQPYTKNEQPYTDDEKPDTGDDLPSSDDEQQYTEDEQPYTEEDKPYSSDDDQPYAEDDRPYSEDEPYDSDSDEGDDHGGHQYTDDGYSDDQQDDYNRSEKFGPDSQDDYYDENDRDDSNQDSFFEEGTYDESIADSAWQTTDQPSYGPGRTLGTLRTLSEENSGLIRSEEGMTLEGESVYDEVTVQSFADGRSYAGASVANTAYADQSLGVTELVSTDDDYDEEGSSYERDHDSGENDPVYEIDTVDTSVVSGDADSAWMSEHGRSKGSMLDQHFTQQHQPPPATVDYTLDENNSILGELSVLDAVKEESTEDGMQSRESSSVRTPLHRKPDAVIKEESERDDSTNYGESVMSPKTQHTQKSGLSKGSGNSYSIYSQSTENTPTEGLQASFAHGDDLESQQQSMPRKSNSFVNQDELESGTSAYRESPSTYSRRNKPSRRKRPETLCCSWPWIILSILIVSIGAGVGIGILYLPRESDDKPAQEETILDLPSLSPEQLQVYEVICPLLETDCESVLLSSSTPQGRAFDWLVNNKEANPELADMDAERKVRRYALATFYFGTEGGKWEINTYWLSDRHECEWFATAFSTCSGNRTVFHSIAMNGNNVQGELPYELSLLTDLTSLVIRNPADTAPYVRGELPSVLGRLTKLTVVEITGNLLSSGIPPELGQWTNIQTLDLSNNGLNGEIPKSLSSCSKLVSLNLEGNYLSGPINGEIFEGTRNLVVLKLTQNRLTSVPSSVALLDQLNTLDLSGNRLSEFPTHVLELDQLTSLDLSGNAFRSAIPQQVGRMRGLVYLNLRNSGLSGGIPVEIGNLVKLELLDLSENELSGSLPFRIGLLVNLKRLFVNNNRLIGLLPTDLSKLDQIEEIRLDHNGFTGQLPEPVCDLYNDITPAAYLDCDEVSSSECFNYCCTAAECRCRFEKTDPLRCVRGLK